MGYLLIAPIPTPNGRLHLGHIGGSFLKLDIIKRINQQIGNVAVLYSGSDSYESHTLLTSYQENKPVAEVCNFYHQQIASDLKTMQIDIDLFINPLASKYKESLISITKKHIQKLKPFEIEELYPFSPSYGFLPPSFIKGECPECQKATAGFNCEACGTIYNFETLKSLSCRLGLPIKLKKINSLFLRIKNDLLSALRNSYVHTDSLELAQKFLRKNEYIRLSLPINWGIAASKKRIYYSYSSVFAYYKLLQAYARQKVTSNLETVISFGFDNTLLYLVEALNLAITTGDKSFDYYLPNKFLTLNGKKFSTSRKHAIWVNQLAKKINIDLLRLFLLKINSDQRENDFNVNEFIIFYNRLATLINERILNQKNEYSNISDCPNIKKIWTDKQKYAIPSNYNANAIYADIIAYLENENYKNNYSVWLQGFAILCYPVMPQLANYITTGCTNGVAKIELISSSDVWGNHE